ncbi:MAG: 4a-hydroxytetrahydrobiopterin dehydratase [Nocardia sp.]|nr:4a-hydroxytetrahydrobiopterin dehydratase [Nocardia sp.]
MTTPLLSESDIADGLRDLPEWTRTGDTITRSVRAATFPAGIELVRKVADAAERAQHHPDIDIRWRTVTFALSTHSAGGLTRKDLELAAVIDDLAGQA